MVLFIFHIIYYHTPLDVKSPRVQSTWEQTQSNTNNFVTPNSLDFGHQQSFDNTYQLSGTSCYLSIYLFSYLSVIYQSIFQSIYQSTNLSIYLSIKLSFYLSIYLATNLSINLIIYLFSYITF